MTLRSELNALLRQLELDIPYMKANTSGFYQEFERRAEVILGVAKGSDAEYAIDCLLPMLFSVPTSHLEV